MARVPPLPPARFLFQMERARDHQLLEHLFQAARRLGSSPGTFVPWRGPGERDAQRVCASGKFVPGGSGSAAGSDSSSGTFLPDSRSAQPHSQAITSRRTPCRLRHDPAGDSRVRRFSTRCPISAQSRSGGPGRFHGSSAGGAGWKLARLPFALSRSPRSITSPEATGSPLQLPRPAAPPRRAQQPDQCTLCRQGAADPWFPL
jgi:hypothetical protein